MLFTVSSWQQKLIDQAPSLFSVKNQVNQALLDLIRASETKTSPYDWTNLPKKSSCERFSFTSPLFLFGSLEILKNLFFLTGWMEERVSLVTLKTEGGGSSVSSKPFLLERLHLLFLYLFGLILLVFGYLRNAVKSLKPVRVGASLTWTNIKDSKFLQVSYLWLFSTSSIELKLEEKFQGCFFPFNFVAGLCSVFPIIKIKLGNEFSSNIENFLDEWPIFKADDIPPPLLSKL